MVLLALGLLALIGRSLYRKVLALFAEAGAASQRLADASDRGREVSFDPVEPQLSVFSDPVQLRGEGRGGMRARHRAGQG